MQKDTFVSTKNWTWTENDSIASAKFDKLLSQTRKSLPENFYAGNVLSYYDQAAKTKLYSWLKTIPKGVLHHNHLDCNEDLEFYRKYISKNPVIYLAEQKTKFVIGTRKQAEENKWVSMEQLSKEFSGEDQLCRYLLNQTTLSTEQIGKYTGKKQAWPVFEKRVGNFLTLLANLEIFINYMKHVFEKCIANGYERVEFRFFLDKLKETDAQGNEVKVHDESKYAEICSLALDQVTRDHPDFSVGYIVFGLKVFSPEQNQKLLTKALSLKWDQLVGIDFVQEQDPYGSLKPYDEIADKVLAKFPGTKVKKVYHAGETRDVLNNNIQIAIEGGSARIGHGVNLPFKSYLHDAIGRNICVEVSVVSNLFLGMITDIRNSHIQTLMNLGIPVSLNSDDPSKFNCEDSTFDYWLSIVSFDWSLKNLKLLAINSINHSLCNEEEKEKIMKNFRVKWGEWINKHLKGE